MLIAVLAAVAAVAGLLSAPYPVTVETVRGGEAVLYGQGVYRYETLFVGSLNRGTDVVTLVLAVPLLLVTTWWARRGSVHGVLLLPGALGWFLYVYATMAVHAAFGPLFVVYLGLFGASLYAFVLALAAAWRLPVRARAGWALPRRGAGTLLLLSGLAMPVIWLGPIVGAQLAGGVPDRLETYTTAVTEAIDTAVIAPAVLLAAVWIWRRESRGYVLAVPLLTLETMLAPMLAAQTVSQLSAGVRLTPAEIAGPLGAFVVLSLAAGWVLARLLAAVAVPGTGPAPPPEARMTTAASREI